MALIPILPDDIKVSSVKVHPNQYFVSSSNSGITGDVYLFAERSSTLKEITGELEEYVFDIQSLLSVDDAGITVRKDRKRSRNDISGLVENYFTNLNKLAGSLDNNKKLIIYRFDMPHRFNSNTVRKSVFIKNLLPFYQGEYEKPLSFGFSNYHSLNFFTSSAAYPSNVPSNTALIYPVPTSGSAALGYKPSRYFTSGSFSFEFYINPRYTSDTSGDSFDAGTIMHMPNCYSVSLVSGSHKDEVGRPKSFRLTLQLGNNTATPPSKISVPITGAATGSIDKRTYISADGFLEKDKWSYCAIRWGGSKQNNFTGSFFIDGQTAGEFVVPNTEFSTGREKFTNLNDIPSALLIGNRYRSSNSLSVDDDDLINVIDGSSYTPSVSNTHASGSFVIKTTGPGSGTTTRKIFFLTTTGSVPTDCVRLNNSNVTSTNTTNLRNAIVGSAVERTGESGKAATATLVFTNAIAATQTITLTDAAGTSRAYQAVNDGSQNYSANPPTFKRGSTAGTASAKAAIIAQSLKEAINTNPSGAGGGHGTTITATNAAGRLTLTQDVKGSTGNRNLANTVSANAAIPAAFTGGVSVMNPQLGGITATISSNKILLAFTGSRIDIIASSSVQITPAQKASGSHGNYLTDIFQISSQEPIYGNSNATASKTAFLFDSGSANTYGNENLLGDIVDDENTIHVLDSPLNAELQEIRIFNKWRTDVDIKATAARGYYNFADKDFLFYLPPYFIPSSSVRQMMSTVTQTHYSSSHTPFNTDLSFGQGGRLINLENFSYDLVTGAQARCYNLSATPPAGTWSNFSADDFDFIPASEAILLKPENRKRNLTILPSDLGQLKPQLSFLDDRTSVLTAGESKLFFVNDAGYEAKGMVNLRNMISIGAQYNELASFDEESGNVDPIVSRLFPKITIAKPHGDSTEFKEISHAEAYGQQSKIGLTILNRTRDPDSSEIMFLDISNIFYGDMIKQKSFTMNDPHVTGSAGKIKLSFKDNGTGGLYRANASGSHPTWASAGIILYEEGLICLTDPTIPPFGTQQFNVGFKGDRNLHILEMRIPISAEEAKISSNPTYKKLSPTDLPADQSLGCNLITNMFIHDENLNVIGKINLSRPIVRKDEDRYVFKFKLDF